MSLGLPDLAANAVAFSKALANSMDVKVLLIELITFPRVPSISISVPVNYIPIE
jgi:hypothetical protein